MYNSPEKPSTKAWPTIPPPQLNVPRTEDQIITGPLMAITEHLWEQGRRNRTRSGELCAQVNNLANFSPELAEAAYSSFPDFPDGRIPEVLERLKFENDKTDAIMSGLLEALRKSIMP